MEKYVPPYELTEKIVSYCTDIGLYVGQMKNIDWMKTLQKSNLVESIFSTCKIEGNHLTFDEVYDLISNKEILVPLKDKKEILNAKEAYEKITSFDTFNLDDLKRAHAILSESLIPHPGEFRKCQEGVFSGDKCIFLAPPPENVEPLMNQLFSWLKDNKNKVNPLIMACVFHYEFVFIHPFEDGNGRTARLWQKLILGKLNPIFLTLSAEKAILDHQQTYYKVINKCNSVGSSTDFIEFMLLMIKESLKRLNEDTSDYLYDTNIYVRRLLKVMKDNRFYTSNELLKALGLKSKANLSKNYITPAIKMGQIRYEFSDKITSRNQRYIKN